MSNNSEICGYILSDKFYRWGFENRCEWKPPVIALYHYLIYLNNSLGWKKEFSVSAKECMEGMGISGYNTFKGAFDVLEKHNFIKVVKKSCNHHQANIITLLNFDKVTDKVTDYSIKIEQGNYQSNGDIHKTNINNIIYGESNDSPTDLSFDFIWSLYGKKGNKKTSLSKWEHLPKKKKIEVIGYVPGYVAATPDKQYRKNFETFINQEGWNDELPVINNTIVKPVNQPTYAKYTDEY